MRTKIWIVLVAAVVGAAAIPSAAHETPGMPQGMDRLKHVDRQTVGTEVVQDNFDLVGRLKLPGKAPEGDIFYYARGKKRTAYLGTFAIPCTGRGVNIVDVSDPAAPKLLSHARLRTGGVSYEDVVVVRIGDRDVLVTGVQACGNARGGVALFDVTRPRHPKKLGFLKTSAIGVHELDAVVREDGSALALVAVPFGTDAQGDFQIIDITDPTAPRRVAGWSAFADSSLPIPHMSDPPGSLGELTDTGQGKGDTALVFGHSVRGADNGMTAYVSYWDAGTLKFDISDPSTPALVTRTTVPFDQEGDAHSVGLFDVDGRRYLLQNSEDLLPSSPVQISSDETRTVAAGAQQIWMRTRLDSVGPITGDLFDAGDGCQAEDYEGAAGKVVLVDSSEPFDPASPCLPADQILLAAGQAPAALLLNGTSERRPDSFWAYPALGDDGAFEIEGFPVVAMWDRDGLAEELRSAPGADPVEVTLDPQAPAWGWVTVFEESAGADADGDGVEELEPVGRFSDLPRVVGDEAYSTGAWTVHNTEVMGDRVYASWYGHGIVALDMTDPTTPALVGQYSKPSERRSDVFDLLAGPGRYASTWGVAVDPARGLVYASDMRTGLWVLRPTGAAAPTTPSG